MKLMKNYEVEFYFYESCDEMLEHKEEMSKRGFQEFKHEVHDGCYYAEYKKDKFH